MRSDYEDCHGGFTHAYIYSDTFLPFLHVLCAQITALDLDDTATTSVCTYTDTTGYT
jgi:hypothetical protein